MPIIPRKAKRATEIRWSKGKLMGSVDNINPIATYVANKQVKETLVQEKIAPLN